MKNFISELNPRRAVTALRFVYPIWAAVGIFSLKYVPGAIIIAGDGAATVNNITGNQLLFSLGIVGALVTQLIHIVAVYLLYRLFKSVNKDHAIFLVVFGLVGVPIAMLSALNLVAALMLSVGAGSLSVFDPAQLEALVMFFLGLNDQGLMIASVFWGLWLLPYGWLAYKSGFFPRVLGILVIIAGLGFTFSFFAHFLFPDFKTLYSVLEALTFGEVLFMLWVMIRGAKIPEVKSGN